MTVFVLNCREFPILAGLRGKRLAQLRSVAATVNICDRVNTSFTGWPAILDAATASRIWGHWRP